MPTLQEELARTRGEEWSHDSKAGRVYLYLNKPTSYEGDPLPVVEESIPERQHPERSYRQWAKHSVDTNGFYYRKRYAQRGNARQEWVGIAHALSQQQDATSFRRGKGLTRKPAKYALYVEGLRKGYLSDINQALAWAKAATYIGLDSQCIEE